MESFSSWPNYLHTHAHINTHKHRGTHENISSQTQSLDYKNVKLLTKTYEYRYILANTFSCVNDVIIAVIYISLSS